MTPENIGELLAPFLNGTQLSARQLQQMSTYLHLLIKWNARTNLTAIRDKEAIVSRHFGESLFSAKRLFTESSREAVLDVGSGAGFPGLPFKIWNPHLDLTLVEANHKKAVFLKEVVRALQLDQVTVVSRRAEQLKLTAQVVSLRAVEKFEAVLPVVRHLVTPGGRLALLIGEAQLDKAKSILRDLRWDEPAKVPSALHRILLVGTAK